MVRLVRKLAKRRRDLRRNESGAAAVEFAIIASVFFTLMMGIVELGMLMLMNNGLEDGIDRAARLLRTGQTRKQDIDATEFRDRICKQVVLAAECRNKLRVDVRSYPDFASINNPPDPFYDKDGKLVLPNDYQKGAPRQVLLVRAYYVWNFYTPLIGKLLSNLGDDKSYLLMVAATLRTEPYSTR